MENRRDFWLWGSAQAFSLIGMIFGDEGRRLLPAPLWVALMIFLIVLYFFLASPYVLDNVAALKSPRLVVSEEYRRRRPPHVVVLLISALMFSAVNWRVAWVLKPELAPAADIDRLTRERDDYIELSREWQKKFETIDEHAAEMQSKIGAISAERDELKNVIRDGLKTWKMRFTQLRDALADETPMHSQQYSEMMNEWAIFVDVTLASDDALCQKYKAFRAYNAVLMPLLALPSRITSPKMEEMWRMLDAEMRSIDETLE